MVEHDLASEDGGNMRRLVLKAFLAAAVAAGPISEPRAQERPGTKGTERPLPGLALSGSSLASVSAEEQARPLLLFAGDPFRNLSGLRSRDSSGREISFAAGQGGPPLTAVSFFATCCCSLCGQELAELKGLRERFPSIRVILVSLDAEVNAGVRAFVAESGLEAPIVHDDVGTIYDAFGTGQVPQTFVVDRQGRIVFEARRYGEGVAVPSWTSPRLVAFLKAAARGAPPNLPQPVRD